MTKIDFSNINTSTAQSFKAQRNLIKKLGRGATGLCETCQQPLSLTTPKAQGKKLESGISCVNGCTDILLEFDN